MKYSVMKYIINIHRLMYIHVDIQYGKQNHQAARSTCTMCDRGKNMQGAQKEKKHSMTLVSGSYPPTSSTVCHGRSPFVKRGTHDKHVFSIFMGDGLHSYVKNKKQKVLCTKSTYINGSINRLMTERPHIA